MSTPYDVQIALKTILENDAALSAWLTTHFNQALTVILGNKTMKVVKSKSFPIATIVAEPQGVSNINTSEAMQLTELYHVDLGMLFNKADELDAAPLQRLGEFEALAAQAILKDRRLGGLVTAITISDRVGDGNVNHPYHFFTLVFRVQRSAPY